MGALPSWPLRAASRAGSRSAYFRQAVESEEKGEERGRYTPAPEPEDEVYDLDFGISLVYVDTNTNIVLSSEETSKRGGEGKTFVTQESRRREEEEEEERGGGGVRRRRRSEIEIQQREEAEEDSLVCLLAHDPNVRRIDSELAALTAAGLLEQQREYEFLRWTGSRLERDPFSPQKAKSPVSVVAVADTKTTLLPGSLDAACSGLFDYVLHLMAPLVGASLELEEVRVSFVERSMARKHGSRDALAALRRVETDAETKLRLAAQVKAERKAREARAAKYAEQERLLRMDEVESGKKVMEQREALAAAAKREAELEAELEKEARAKEEEAARLRRAEIQQKRWRALLEKQKEALEREKNEKEAELKSTLASITAAEQEKRESLAKKETELEQLRGLLVSTSNEMEKERKAATAAASRLAALETKLHREEEAKSEALLKAQMEHERAVAAEKATAERIHAMQSSMLDVQGRLDAAEMERRELLARLEESEKSVLVRDDAREELLAMTSVCGVGVSNMMGRGEHDAVVITQLAEGGPAQAAGLREGDLVYRVGEIETKERSHFMHVLHAAFPGETEVFYIKRDGKALKVPVQFGAKGATLDHVRNLRRLAGDEWCQARDDGVEGVTDLGRLALSATLPPSSPSPSRRRR